MPYRRKTRRPIRRRKKRQLQPRRKGAVRGKIRLQNKVELLSIKTLKPKSIVKKFQYYNTMEVHNHLLATNQNSQFITLNLNSPWLLNSTTYAQQGINVWNFNTPMAPHTNGHAVASGTSYPAFFTNESSPGLAYQQQAVIGTKVTITATPISSTEACGPTALFAVIETQPTTYTNTLDINELYSTPYAQVRKVTGNQSGYALTGNTKSAKIVVRYSPKKFNNIKDLRDNHNFYSATSAPSLSATGSHPAEKDRLTFGLVNCFSNPNVAQPCCPVMIQVKVEAIVIFSEPFPNQNIFPAAPAGGIEIVN